MMRLIVLENIFSGKSVVAALKSESGKPSAAQKEIPEKKYATTTVTSVTAAARKKVTAAKRLQLHGKQGFNSSPTLGSKLAYPRMNTRPGAPSSGYWARPQRSIPGRNLHPKTEQEVGLEVLGNLLSSLTAITSQAGIPPPQPPTRNMSGGPRDLLRPSGRPNSGPRPQPAQRRDSHGPLDTDRRSPRGDRVPARSRGRGIAGRRDVPSRGREQDPARGQRFNPVQNSPRGNLSARGRMQHGPKGQGRGFNRNQVATGRQSNDQVMDNFRYKSRGAPRGRGKFRNQESRNFPKFASGSQNTPANKERDSRPQPETRTGSQLSRRDDIYAERGSRATSSHQRTSGYKRSTDTPHANNDASPSKRIKQSPQQHRGFNRNSRDFDFGNAGQRYGDSNTQHGHNLGGAQSGASANHRASSNNRDYDQDSRGFGQSSSQRFGQEGLRQDSGRSAAHQDTQGSSSNSYRDDYHRTGPASRGYEHNSRGYEGDNRSNASSSYTAWPDKAYNQQQLTSPANAGQRDSANYNTEVVSRIVRAAKELQNRQTQGPRY